MRLDTVQLFPHVERMLLVFRGVTDVVEDDASDVQQLVAACEHAGSPRPLSHYEAVLAERLDKKRGALAALRDRDLMPPGPGAKTSIDELVDPDLATPFENLKRNNLQRKADQQFEQAREKMRAQGLDPDEHLPKGEAPSEDRYVAGSLDEVEGVVERVREDAAKLKAQAEAGRASAEEQARAQCKANGLDFDKVLAEQKAKSGGPPKFSAAAEMQKLRDVLVLTQNAGMAAPELQAQLDDPHLYDKLKATEQRLLGMYRKHAHRLAEAPPADPALVERARIELPAGTQGGVSFAGRDLTGVDLSGLDLRGVDLSEALLEGANLQGADLRGADLRGAVLARANLRGADLYGAQMARTNFGRATLVDAKLGGGVDMTRTIFNGSDLTGADLKGAKMNRVDLSEAIFCDTDMAQVECEHINIMKSDLRGVSLAGASFKKCNLIEVDLSGVDLTGADLTGTAMVTVKADRAVFRHATLVKLRVVHGSSMEGADFSDARLSAANMRKTKLAGCDFSRAELGAADLSECDLRGARFYRATGREMRLTKADLSQAVFTGANLMCALVDRAKLHGTSFLGANLFRADFAKVDVDGGTVMKDANMTQLRFVEARRPHGTELSSRRSSMAARRSPAPTWPA